MVDFWGSQATDFRSSQKAQLRFDQFCFEEKYAIITLLKEHSDSVYNIFNYSRQKIDAIVNAIDKVKEKSYLLTSTGYGDVHPFTVTGQILTIIYAVFGIPLNIAFTADFGELITKAISAITEYFRLLCNKGDQREGNKAQQLSQEVLFIIVSFVTTVYVNFLTIVVLFVERAQGWTFMDSMHFTFGSVSLIGFGDLVTRREKHYVFIVMPLLFIGETLMALVFGHLQRTFRFHAVVWAKLIVLQIRKTLRKRCTRDLSETNTEKGVNEGMPQGKKTLEKVDNAIKKELNDLRVSTQSEDARCRAVPIRSSRRARRKIRSKIKVVLGGTPPEEQSLS
uniref:Potassium channel domain-containing protein n=1 Tax=Parascaris equorum TaxID=6256 RepID=A0A914RZ40_PAREQ